MVLVDIWQGRISIFLSQILRQNRCASGYQIVHEGSAQEKFFKYLQILNSYVEIQNLGVPEKLHLSSDELFGTHRRTNFASESVKN